VAETQDIATLIRVELCACEMTILSEIADRRIPRRSVALTYAMTLRSSEDRDGLVNWRTINEAIVGRWGRRGLAAVKNLAWKLIDGRRNG
jgi:hypothetical protein